MEENNKLFIAQYEDKWFGVIVDEEDRLVASAFSDNREKLGKHFAHCPEILSRSKRITGSPKK